MLIENFATVSSVLKMMYQGKIANKMRIPNQFKLVDTELPTDSRYVMKVFSLTEPNRDLMFKCVCLEVCLCSLLVGVWLCRILMTGVYRGIPAFLLLLNVEILWLLWNSVCKHKHCNTKGSEWQNGTQEVLSHILKASAAFSSLQTLPCMHVVKWG